MARHFDTIARREGFPIGTPVAYDYSQYVHQVPGGMISNLAHQLREVGAQNRLPDALEETVRVRAEFGYPIMVTPLSQFVGSQAAMNVIVGERYKQVTDQVIRYALGHYGEDGHTLMDPDVRDKILDRPRARELADIAARRSCRSSRFAATSAAPACRTRNCCCASWCARTTSTPCARPDRSGSTAPTICRWLR